MKKIVFILYLSFSMMYSSENSNSNTNESYQITILYADGMQAGENDSMALEARELLNQEIERGFNTDGLESIDIELDRQTGQIFMNYIYNNGDFGGEYLGNNRESN